MSLQLPEHHHAFAHATSLHPGPSLPNASTKTTAMIPDDDQHSVSQVFCRQKLAHFDGFMQTMVVLEDRVAVIGG